MIKNKRRQFIVSCQLTEVDQLGSQGICFFQEPEALQVIKEWKLADTHYVLCHRQNEGADEATIYKVEEENRLCLLSDEEWNTFVEELDQYLYLQDG